MKNRQKILAIVLAAAMSAAALAGCAAAAPAAAPAPAQEAAAPAEAAPAPAEEAPAPAEEETGEAAPAQGAYKAVMSAAITGSTAEKAEEFCGTIEELTGGAITCDFLGNSALGAQRDVVNMLAAGEVELMLEGSVPTDMFAPEYNFLVAPYMFRSAEHLMAIVDSPIYDQYIAKLEENGITILGTYVKGARNTVTTEEVDWSNPASIIIRMPDVAAYIAAWQGLGANTQIVPYSELYSALQTGIVNAAENSWDQVYSSKLFEVAKYMYETEHVQEFYCVYASKKWFDSLDADVQTALKDGIVAWCEEMGEFSRGEVEKSKAVLIDEGMELKEVDKDALVDAVAPVWEEKFASGEWASTYEEVMSFNPEN